jgi:hypothetical protein
VKTLLKKTLSAAISGWAALILLAALSLMYVLGRWIPQRMYVHFRELAQWKERWPGLGRLFDALGFFDIYTSPLFLLLLGAFMAIVAALIILATPGVLRRCRGDRPAGVTAPLVELQAEGTAEEVLARAKRSLRGYRFHVEGGRFAAVRFRFGPIGVLLLYGAMFLLLVGGLTVFYTKTGGKVILTEGQVFNGDLREYEEFRLPLVGGPPPIAIQVAGIRLKDDEPEVKLFLPTAEGLRKKEFRGGERASLGDIRLSVTDTGVAPHLVLEGPGGMLYEDAFVNLRVLHGGRDGYRFPATPYMAEFRFYPDYYKGRFGDATRSLQMKNPAFRVFIYKGGRMVKDILLRPGEATEFEGFELAIKGIRSWGKFTIQSQRGTGLLKAGAAIGVLGLLWSFVFYRREIQGEIGEGRILLSGRGDFFPGFNERRVRRLAKNLFP